MKKFFWSSAAILVAVLGYFVFAPAFQGELLISPAFSFGAYGFRFYGLTMALSILAGYLIARSYSWRFGIDPKEIDDFSFWVVIVSFLGARLYFVAFDYKYFLSDPSEIYKIWHGGLSIYGAVFSGLVFTLWYTRKKAYTSWQLLDVLGLSLPLAQALGRFGNFFNQEAYGPPTDLPWKMHVAPRYRPVHYPDSIFFHPTFLYEALLNVIVFLVLRRLVGKKSGVVFLSYLMFYGAIRFMTEFVRLDSVLIRGFSVDQVVSLIVFMLAGFVLLRKVGKLSL